MNRTKLDGILFGAALFALGICLVGVDVSAQSRGQGARSQSKSSQPKKVRRKTARLNEPTAPFETEGDPDKRRDWFISSRMYPFKEIPVGARRRAWETRPEEASFGPSLAVTRRWKSIGPRPTESALFAYWGLTSGRINSVAISPANSNIVLVGGAVGGIWRSTDGGANFVPVTDSQADLAVGAIAFSASNPSIVYASMGDYIGGYLGSGVLKSTDAGATWTKVSGADLAEPMTTTRILVDPNNPNNVFVAKKSVLFPDLNEGYMQGFIRSTDGGVTWTRTWSGAATDLVRHPTQPNTFYLGGTYCSFLPTAGVTCDSTAAGVWKSTDAGVNWTRIYSSPVASASNVKVAVTPAAPSNVYVLSGTSSGAQLGISTNNGQGFTNIVSTIDTGQFSYNAFLFVSPTDVNKIFIGTRDLWISSNAGSTWTNATNNFTAAGGYQPTSSKAHPDQHHLAFSPADSNTIYIAGDGGLYKSTNGGSTFSSLNSTLSLSMFVGMDLHPTHPFKTYGGTQDNGTQKRGPTSWKEFSTGDGGQTVVDVLDPSIVFATYVQHAIFKYTNEGATSGGAVSSSVTFNNDRVDFYPPFVGNGVDSTLYFGTYRLYKSSNRGASWTAPAGATDLTKGSGDVLSSIAVSRSNTNVIYTGSASGRVMVSTDGGVSYTDRTTGLPNRYIASITVHPTSSTTAWVTVLGFASGHVFKTTNSGATWTDISGNLPNIPTSALLLDPRNANTIYVGTDIGVFRSKVGGTTWESFNSGMPPAVVTKLDAQPNGIIQAATYGRGVYELDDRRVWMDFDGDQKTDVSVFRPSGGSGGAEWWYLNSSNGGYGAAGFGTSTDKPVPADFTGDGITDIAFYRPSTGFWYVIRSEDSSFYGFPFGNSTDTPVAADFDGDGKADYAVYRASSATWFILRSSDGVVAAVPFGLSTDKPAVSDYDGDGKADIAIFRPNGGSGAEWWLYRSKDGVIGIAFGSSTDKAVPGDYTGDGKADVALFRPSNGNWYILRSDDFSFYAFPFGSNGDIPSPGDYDNDKKFDAAVYRPSQTTWFINQSTDGFRAAPFGLTSDNPLPSTIVKQ